jgi:hypothetical protein
LLETVVAVAGAGIVIASAMVTGLRIERVLGAPYGIGSSIGLLVGVAVVASWLSP